jgi:hypothetical protein
MSLAGDRTPEMPPEKRDLPDFPTESCPNEANTVEVKFGGTVAILFGRADLHRLNRFHNRQWGIICAH